MTERNDGDAASQRSGASSNSGNMSETSSQQSDAKFLRKRALKGQHGANDETDLLEQKKSFQEGVFACMYTLVRQSALSQLAFAVLKVVLEFLMNFIVAFNPSFKTWRIDTSSPLWQVVRWAVWRSPIMRLYGYKTYVIVMYVMASLVLVAVVGLVWLTLAMRKQEQSKVLRTAATALHVVFDIMFVMCYVSFFDCSFLSTKEHLYFTGVACLEMPHLLHMLVALSAAALFLIVTALVVVASAELNPVSCAYLSTPASVVRLKILFTKAVYVILADCLDSHSRLQSLGMAAAVVLILYWNFRAMPFYRKTVNIVWTGLWGGVLYTCLVLNVVTFGKDQSPERHREMTKLVLLGIFPAILMTMLVQALYVWWAMRPARKFRNLELGIKLSKVYKFESVYEVERLARVMRKFDTEGLVEEDAAALGETIIKAGLQTFPNAPHLLILYANFVLEVRKDGPASRTQLQLAAKHSPDIIQRYQIFCTYEASKRLKGSQQDCMDLQAYTEFKRNFRAVLRVHREVLVMQAELWQLCMRPSLRVRQFDEALDALEAASSRANQVYKRVIERYPSNGKLLRCYGKFLEDARHDHVAAVRAYTAANRNGAGMALLSLDLSSGLHGGDKPDFLTSMSLEDDAVVVIDAEGTIMMVSQAVQKTFGYAKTELEGANVSILMPQPFSQRHDAYLSRYVASGEAQILDSVREVVALHKDRYVFPVALCVTRLSGVGTDSIFLGVIRPLPPDIRNLRAWIAPNGVFLCSDQQFASSIGVFEGDLVGHPLSSLAVNSEEVEALLERCKAASAAELASGEITAQLTLRHSYTAPVPMAAVVRLAGTDTQRILVLHCRRTDGLDGSMLAVDTHMRVKFASCEVALLLGYSMRKLASMRLDQLLPPPYNALHAKWLRDPPHVVPPASCRSGSVVHLQPESGFPVPVRLQISVLDNAIQGASTAAATLYVVQVHKVPADELFHEKRLVLTLDFAGKVLMVSPPDSAMFDFPALSLIGTNVSDSVDIFADWRQRSGDAQMQLILLALLYKEQEMPGTSWRVRVHRPESDKEAATAMSSLAAGSVRAGGSRRNSLSACLQVEMQDNRDEFQAIDRDGTGEHEPRVRVTLWRRDRLTSVLELDEELIIRRASPLTGLITGLPTSAMLRKPLSRFLNIPHSASWDKLVAATRQPGHGHHKKSALKATTDRGSISPVMAFIGPHPDSGTMRLMVQGVQTLGPGGRPKVTLTMHPDTTFVGAHANLMRVLRLNADIDRRATADGGAVADDDGVRSLAGGQARSRASSAWQSRTARKMKSMKQSAAVEEEGDGAAAGDALDALAAEAETKTEAELGANGDSESTNGLEGLGNSDEENAGRDGGGGEERPDSRSKQREVVKATRGELEDDNEDPGASLHRQSTSKSEFVAQWVRTLSHRVSGRLCLEAPLQQQPPGTPGGGEDGSSGGVLPQSRGSSRLAAAAACAPSRLSTIREAADAGAAEKQLDLATQPSSAGYLLHRVNSRRDWADAASMPQAGSPAAKSGGGASHRDSHEDDVEGGPVDAGKEEKAMSESGESSADGSQAAGSIISSATDATSVSEYMIDSRRGRLLKALHKQLLGPALMKHVDRLRLQSFLLIGIMFVAHVIAYSIITSMIKTEHDYVYSVHRQAMAMDRSQLIIVRSVAGAFCERANVTEKVSVCANSLSFTLDKLKTNIARMEEYHQGVYLGFDKNNVDRLSQNVYDVWTKHGLEYHAGAWQLGNRFIAAAREALYLLPKLRDNYKLHRTYQFIKTNGLGPLFEGYAASLDMLVDAAWASIGKLRMDLLVTLVVEAIVVQLCCTCYELYLVQRTEWARLLGVLAMLGLPGPVLRQLASSDTRIVDDSDDESDDDDDDSRAGDEEERRGGATAARAGDNNSGDRDSAPDRDRDRGGAGLVPTAAPQLQSGDVAEPADVAGPLQRLERKPADLSNEPRANPAPKHVVRLLSGRRNLSNDGQVDGMAAPASAPSSKPGSPKLDVEERPLPAAGGQANAPALRAVSPRKAARTRGQQSISRFWMQINGKTLRPSFWNVAKFMVPFFLWNLAVILVYAVSLMKLNGMQGPLASLNMASHVTYRYTRVRAIALAFVTQDDAASRDVWRPMLLSELSLFESEYNAVMYGGEPSSMAKSTFRRVVPAGTFASSSFAQAFFRSKACFRYDKSTCFPPGHVYYEVTHNGLDVMVRRMLSEMKLLAEDADQDVAYNSSRYTFMAVVGANDLYEGLQQAAELFVDYSISRYVEVSILHTALLCISVALVLGFFVFVLWPHIRLLLRDAARLGALLSMVPPEMDVRAHVRGVLRRATGRALRQTLAAAATAATTPLATSAGASSGVDKSATTGRPAGQVAAVNYPHMQKWLADCSRVSAFGRWLRSAGTEQHA
ncbi:hypothetical protein VOLCADRAFT_104960 [Volvox carteri f. nagariensis]|uniref:PAS domain-containing protein n=1 Tax=Volvox carteri f. nagariensis TaxID=3068 RepID=D8TXF5_VOLCA|nr:uncharacterized protein VOLCADRAFT_104960 [Volvox carteri f. nagariensis]EFJ47903.1 hypothetical protein VOLCADRAFT_104960 [Volvox carteri f. nagariensis]|eukprot:XP_002951009.1 hypothetical protein VOLCADRAFT_104960 [Volvox carteri f. nagariensis]